MKITQGTDIEKLVDGCYGTSTKLPVRNQECPVSDARKTRKRKIDEYVKFKKEHPEYGEYGDRVSDYMKVDVPQERNDIHSCLFDEEGAEVTTSPEVDESALEKNMSEVSEFLGKGKTSSDVCTKEVPDPDELANLVGDPFPSRTVENQKKLVEHFKNHPEDRVSPEDADSFIDPSVEIPKEIPSEKPKPRFNFQFH